MEDIVEEVEKTATKIMPFIQGLLASGHGVHILTAPSEHRTKPKVINGGGGELYSIEQLPSTGVGCPHQSSSLAFQMVATLETKLSGGYALTTTTRPSMH